MKIVFFSQDKDMEKMAKEALVGHTVCFCQKLDQIESALKGVKGSVLFIDWGMGPPDCNLIMERFKDQGGLMQLGITREQSTRDIKRFQEGAQALDGYLKWPLGGEHLAQLVGDMASVHSAFNHRKAGQVASWEMPLSPQNPGQAPDATNTDVLEFEATSMHSPSDEGELELDFNPKPAPSPRGSGAAKK